MDMYGINHESISDYGLRKVLGIRTPASRYFGMNSTSPRDTYISTRKKVKEKDCLNIKIDKKLLNIIGIVGGSLLTMSLILKKKRLPVADAAGAGAAAAGAAKKGLFCKIKTLFTKK